MFEAYESCVSVQEMSGNLDGKWETEIHPQGKYL